MDGKGSRRLSSKNDRPRQNVVEIGKKYAKFLIIHKQSLLAGILLTGMVILLLVFLAGFRHLLSTRPLVVRRLLITPPSKSK